MTGEGEDAQGRRLWRCDICQWLGVQVNPFPERQWLSALEVLEPGIAIEEDADLLEGGE